MQDWHGNHVDDSWLTPEENAQNRRLHDAQYDVTAVASIASDPTLDPGTLQPYDPTAQPPRTEAAVTTAAQRPPQRPPRPASSGVTAARAAGDDPIVWKVPPDLSDNGPIMKAAIRAAEAKRRNAS